MTRQNAPTTPQRARVASKRSKGTNPSSTTPERLERILAIGDRVRINDMVLPKQYASKRGVITSVNDGEYLIGGAWFKAVELT